METFYPKAYGLFLNGQGSEQGQCGVVGRVPRIDWGGGQHAMFRGPFSPKAGWAIVTQPPSADQSASLAGCEGKQRWMHCGGHLAMRKRPGLCPKDSAIQRFQPRGGRGERRMEAREDCRGLLSSMSSSVGVNLGPPDSHWDKQRHARCQALPASRLC